MRNKGGVGQDSDSPSARGMMCYGNLGSEGDVGGGGER